MTGRPPANPYLRLLLPGDALVITRVRPKHVHEQVGYLRRSRGWDIRTKQQDFGIEIRRYA